MAKRSKKRKAAHEDASPPSRPRVKASQPRSISGYLTSPYAIALFLAVVTFLVYWPSLSSDFVYDARLEILSEGFITSLSNLPAVLSMKVMSMHLVLGTRPGHLLYLMLIAAVSGKEPFGYHLCSNLLHAANVALLFVLLVRLTKLELGSTEGQSPRILMAISAVTLIFALHPLSVEAVAAVNYSSDLLVTLFTLLALLTAMEFKPENSRSVFRIGAIGTLCAFAAVTCKESGLAVCGLLIVYWFLYRRREAIKPWLCFLGAATAVTLAFLVARFLLAPTASAHPLPYLGGSFSQVFVVQPRYWVFMMGKLIWPLNLSADYTPENLSGVTTPVAFVVLALVLLLQGWLATRSRLGALGVAIYWLGLLTVSNFIPIFRTLADRFYYLPLVGVAMQLLALIFLTLKSRSGYWAAMIPSLLALIPFAFLTISREAVFANENALWTDTLRVSPDSSTAHLNYGTALAVEGKVDEAMVHFQKGVDLSPNNAQAHDDLGHAFLVDGRIDEAIVQFQTALGDNANFPEAHFNLGYALLQKGRVDEAIAQFQQGEKLAPESALGHYNLANGFRQQGRLDEAISEYQKALELDPSYAQANNNLGTIFSQKGQVDDAIAQFQRALAINPVYPQALINLGNSLLQKGRASEAIADYQELLRLNPNDADAQKNLARAEAMAQQAGNSK
jgi:tetratricopeptide (TPR) repeat protein